MGGEPQANSNPGNHGSPPLPARREEAPFPDFMPHEVWRAAPLPPVRNALDRWLARLGGLALIIGLSTAGLLLASLAMLVIGLLLPVAIVAGLTAALSLGWLAHRRNRPR